MRPQRQRKWCCEMYKGGELPAQAHGDGCSRCTASLTSTNSQRCCMEAISGALSEQLDEGMLSAVFGQPKALLESEPLRPLRESSAAKLMETFGDVPAIITSIELRNQFCSLPYEAVLTWLKVCDCDVHCLGHCILT